MKDAKQNLNGACQYLGALVTELRPGDESSIEAVKLAFTTLENAIARVNRDLDRLQNAVGPVKIPPDHVRQ